MDCGVPSGEFWDLLNAKKGANSTSAVVDFGN